MSTFWPGKKQLAIRYRRIMDPINPSTPRNVGNRKFRERSSWGLDPLLCSCDLQFTKWLEEQGLTQKVIFHFGSGSHHHVGIRCHESGRGEVLAVTASKREHDAYVKRVLEAPDLAISYKLLFVDIYSLSEHLLPSFDLVTLFHLGEFEAMVGEGEDRLKWKDDSSLLQMFVKKLKEDGQIVFYMGSFGWGESEKLLDRFIDRGWLEKKGTYEQLLIASKGPYASSIP